MVNFPEFERGMKHLGVSLPRELLEQFFSYVDKSGDGEIDFGEFAATVRDQMRVSADIVSDEELQGLFLQADIDGEGSLDATDFAQWIAAQPAATDDPRMSEVKEVVHKASYTQLMKSVWNHLFR